MPGSGRPKLSKDVVWHCKGCGFVEVLPDWAAAAKIYCSRQCFCDSGGLRVPKQGPRPKLCATCGEEFMVGGESNPRAHTKYCSQECRNGASWRQPPANQLSDIDCAWLAGLFDGEGSIVREKGRAAHTVRITITNTHLPLLERVHELAGTGSIIELARYKKNPKHSDSWNWQCYGENARNLLRQMYPHLIVKKERADQALS